MAIEAGGSKFGYSVKYKPRAGVTTTKTKTINYINMQLTDQGSGVTIDDVYNFAIAVNTSIVGGVLPEVSIIQEYPLEVTDNG